MLPTHARIVIVGGGIAGCSTWTSGASAPSWAKLLLQGRDALAVLQRVCAADVDAAPGLMVYSAVLNAHGGFESDLTVIRLPPERGIDRFLIVTGSAQGMRDADWIGRHVGPHEQAVLTDVSAQWCVLSVMGPRARALLACASPTTCRWPGRRSRIRRRSTSGSLACGPRAWPMSAGGLGRRLGRGAMIGARRRPRGGRQSRRPTLQPRTAPTTDDHPLPGRTRGPAARRPHRGRRAAPHGRGDPARHAHR